MEKTFEIEMEHYNNKFDKQVEKYQNKIAKKTEILTKKYAENPEKQKLELAVMKNNWNVYIDIANTQRDEKKRTLLIKYGLDD